MPITLPAYWQCVLSEPSSIELGDEQHVSGHRVVFQRTNGDSLYCTSTDVETLKRFVVGTEYVVSLAPVGESETKGQS